TSSSIYSFPTRRSSDLFYQPGEYDLAGFATGVVEKAKVIDGKKVRPGDVVLGVPSSGLHSNGYSLVRKVFSDAELKKRAAEFLRDRKSTRLNSSNGSIS